MIPLHYMRWWLSTSINYTRRHSHGRGAGTAHFASAAAATHLALAGSAGCVLLFAVCHKAMRASACSCQAYVAAPGAEAASALCMTGSPTFSSPAWSAASLDKWPTQAQSLHARLQRPSREQGKKCACRESSPGHKHGRLV